MHRGFIFGAISDEQPCVYPLYRDLAVPIRTRSRQHPLSCGTMSNTLRQSVTWVFLRITTVSISLFLEEYCWVALISSRSSSTLELQRLMINRRHQLLEGTMSYSECFELWFFFGLNWTGSSSLNIERSHDSHSMIMLGKPRDPFSDSTIKTRSRQDSVFYIR